MNDPRVELLLKYFFSRTDKIAFYAAWNAPQHTNGGDLLEAILNGHIRGNAAPITEVHYTNRRGSDFTKNPVRIGSYTPNPDGMTKWLCIDFDGGPEHANGLIDPKAAVIEAQKTATSFGLSSHIECSGGGKGWHLWIFFDPMVPAKQARQLGLLLCPPNQPCQNGEIGDPKSNKGMEVFPKQPRIKKDGFGNLIWLPWWWNAQPGGNQFYRIDDTSELSQYLPESFATVAPEQVEQTLAAHVRIAPESEPTRRNTQSTEPPQTPKSNSSEWVDWREQALQKLRLEDVYGDYLTGRQTGAEWLECRDPASASGDQSPSAGIATGAGNVERGAFHSFLTGKTISVFDFLIRQGRADDFRAARKVVEQLTGVAYFQERTSPSTAPLRQIVTNKRPIFEVITEAWEVVHAENRPPHIFINQSNLVRVARTSLVSDGIKELSEVELFGFLIRKARWVKTFESGISDTFPSREILRDMVALPDQDLPVLDDIKHTPVFTSEGKLLTQKGYHPSANIWLDIPEALNSLEIPDVIALFKENPYQVIASLRGFGFKKIDLIARKMGVLKASPERLRAGLLHAVDEQIDNGHCWVSFDDLVEHANELLILDTLDSHDHIVRELVYLISDGQLFCKEIAEQRIIARPDLYAKENDIRAWLSGNLYSDSHLANMVVQEGILDHGSSSLNEGQRSAVLLALQHQVSVIAGGAGSGKTYTVGTITRICEEVGLSVTLAAPTGKAAKRLEQLTDHEAVTLHRLLGYNGRVFLCGPEVPIETDVLVVDEFSMVDVLLAWQLFRAIDWKHTSLVMVGDPNQLPPVGPGNILRDLLSTQLVPTTILNRIVRQAGLLKENCTAILSGEVRKTAPEIPGQTRKPWFLIDQFTDTEDVRQFLLDMFSNLLSERLGYDLIRDVQLISPTKKGPLGTVELNIALQQLLQKKLFNVDVTHPKPGQQQRRFYRHDKVIQTRNNYDTNVMNGSIGWVTNTDPKEGITVEFENGIVTTIESGAPELLELSLAYALTVHKVQGSEFPCVVAVIHKSHSFMHHRNLFYTAVTRARECAIVIGDRWGLKNCARIQQTERRRTFLSLATTMNLSKVAI